MTYFLFSKLIYTLLSISFLVIICQYRFTPLSICCWTLSNLIAISLQFFIGNDQMMTYHMCLLCTDDIDTSIYPLIHVTIIYHPHYSLLGRHSSFRYIPPLLLIAVVFGCFCCRDDPTLCSQHLHNNDISYVCIFKSPIHLLPSCIVLNLMSRR